MVDNYAVISIGSKAYIAGFIESANITCIPDIHGNIGNPEVVYKVNIPNQSSFNNRNIIDQPIYLTNDHFCDDEIVATDEQLIAEIKRRGLLKGIGGI